MHPLYSRHLAPSEYHLFRPLQNSLNGKAKLTSKEACENHVSQFFAQKSHRSFTVTILRFLPQKWQTMVERKRRVLCLTNFA